MQDDYLEPFDQAAHPSQSNLLGEVRRLLDMLDLYHLEKAILYAHSLRPTLDTLEPGAFWVTYPQMLRVAEIRGHNPRMVARLLSVMKRSGVFAATIHHLGEHPAESKVASNTLLEGENTFLDIKQRNLGPAGRELFLDIIAAIREGVINGDTP